MGVITSNALGVSRRRKELSSTWTFWPERLGGEIARLLATADQASQRRGWMRRHRVRRGVAGSHHHGVSWQGAQWTYDHELVTSIIR